MANALIMRPLPMTFVSGTTTAVGTATNIFNDYMGVIWSTSSFSSGGLHYIFVQVDLGADIAIDTIAALGLTATGATDAVAYAEFRTNAAGPTGSNTVTALQPAFTGAQLANGDYHSLIAPAAPMTARYVNLSFRSSSAFTVRIRRLAIGKRLILDRNFSFGAGFGVRDFGNTDFSNRGVLLRRRSKKLRTLALTFSSLHKDEAENIVFPMLEAVGGTDPVLLVTNSADDPNLTRHSYFGPITGELGMVWRTADAFEWKAQLVSLI